MKSIFLMPLFILLQLTASCNDIQQVICETQDINEQSSKEEINDPISIHTMTIKRRDITSEMVYPAAIKGRQQVKIIPRIDGYLDEIMVKEGNHVKRGQILFTIDTNALKNEVNIAKANIAIAKTGVTSAELNYQSRYNLRQKNIISEHELLVARTALDSAKAQLEQAKAQFEAARTNLSLAIIKSPCDGIVGKISYHAGDFVSQGIEDGLTTVADTSEMYLYFSLSEREMVKLITTYGSFEKVIASFPPVSLRLIDGLDYPHKGRIESISGVIDPQTGAFALKAIFPNPSGLLLSGGTGQLVINHEYKNVIIIPQSATFNILDKTLVYKIVDGQTKATVVQVANLSDGQNFLVSTGLIEGDEIISNGAAYLQEGLPVKNAAQDNKESGK